MSSRVAGMTSIASATIPVTVQNQTDQMMTVRLAARTAKLPRIAIEAPAGSSILVSILLRPPAGRRAAELTLVAGLAAAIAVERATALAAQLKSEIGIPHLDVTFADEDHDLELAAVVAEALAHQRELGLVGA